MDSDFQNFEYPRKCILLADLFGRLDFGLVVSCQIAYCRMLLFGKVSVARAGLNLGRIVAKVVLRFCLGICELMREISLFYLDLVARLFLLQTCCINPFLKLWRMLVSCCCRNCVGYIFILAKLNRGFRFCFLLINIYRLLFLFVHEVYHLLEALLV